MVHQISEHHHDDLTPRARLPRRVASHPSRRDAFSSLLQARHDGFQATVTLSSSASTQRGWRGQPGEWHRDDQDLISFLRTVRAFALLPLSTLHQILAASSTRRIPRGSFIFLQGEPIASIHLLLEGRIKIVRETEEGRAVIMRLIEPGDLFGIVGQWSRATYRNCALAQTNATVLAVPRTVFASLMASDAAFALAILDELGKRLNDAEERIQDLQTERAACRTARVLLKLFDGAKGGSGEAPPTVPLSRQDLADLCGTNLSTASRTLSEWEQDGIIDAGRERVKLLRPGVLAAIAGGRA